jgi:transcription elongation GreA/GreB family factor
MTSYLALLEEDVETLEREVAEAERRVAEALQARIAALDGDEIHENAAFDHANQELGMWQQRCAELRSLRSRAEIVKPRADGLAGIGTVVTYVDCQTREVARVRLVGYLGSRVEQVDDVGIVSTASPLGRLLEGHGVGEIVSGQLGRLTAALDILAVG